MNLVLNDLEISKRNRIGDISKYNKRLKVVDLNPMLRKYLKQRRKFLSIYAMQLDKAISILKERE